MLLQPEGWHLADAAQEPKSAVSTQCRAFLALGDGPRGRAKCGYQRRQASLDVDGQVAVGQDSARFHPDFERGEDGTWRWQSGRGAAGPGAKDTEEQDSNQAAQVFLKPSVKQCGF